MKSLYTVLIAMVAFVVFASVAVADPGTPWDKKIAGKGRFQVLNQFGGDAVLDKETGRVWEKQPSTGGNTWLNRLTRCYNLEVGGRKGWRVPTIEELASLVDTSQANPSLPLGHPFINVQSSDYWSATTLAGSTSDAWVVGLDVGNVFASGKANVKFVWCVRGGQGVDGAQ